MATKTLTNPWLDRFTKPQTRALIETLPEEIRPQVEDLRSRFAGIEGVREQIEWMGLPWRWTLVYTTPAHPSSRALAYIVPDPEGVRVGIPLDQSVIHHAAGPKANRSLRESMVQSSRVGGVVWPEWALGASALPDELVSIVRAKATTEPAQDAPAKA